MCLRGSPFLLVQVPGALRHFPRFHITRGRMAGPVWHWGVDPLETGLLLTPLLGSLLLEAVVLVVPLVVPLAVVGLVGVAAVGLLAGVQCASFLADVVRPCAA